MVGESSTVLKIKTGKEGGLSPSLCPRHFLSSNLNTKMQTKSKSFCQIKCKSSHKTDSSRTELYHYNGVGWKRFFSFPVSPNE